MTNTATPGTAEPVAAPKDQALDKRLLARWQGIPVSFRIVGGIGVVFVFIFIRFTVDDAFISWRYALTLVRSGQWNYSAGIPRVEGYTNFLFAAVAVLPALLQIPIELFFKVLALGILGGYLLAVRRCALSRLQTLALVAIASCNPGFMIMLFSGLETVSFALLIALVFGLVYRNGGLGPWGYLAAFALSLSRPEGIVLAGVAMVWSLVVTRRMRQLGGLLVVVGAWGLYWVSRWSYFGYFWPSSYYVKSGSRGEASAQLVNVLDNLVPVAVVAGLVLLVAALVPQLDRRRLRVMVGRPQDATPAILAGASAVVILGLYHSSSLEMNFVNRFQWQLLFPVVLVALARPLAILDTSRGWRKALRMPSRLPSSAEAWSLLAIVLATVISVADAPARLTQIAVTGAVVVVAVAVVLRVALGKPAATVLAAVALAVVLSSAAIPEMLGWATYRIRLQYAHQAMGEAIDAAPFTGAVAIGDAGLLPFKVHQPAIDLFGLANAEITHGTFSTADLTTQHLDLVVALSGSSGAGSQWSSGPGQQATYAYMVINQWPSAAGAPFNYGYWLNYWVNPEVNTPELEADLQRAAAAGRQTNLQSDSQLLLHHFFDLPFLTNGN